MSLTATEMTVKDPKIQGIMQNESFDVFITCYMFNLVTLGLATHFKIPSVVVSPVPLLKDFADTVGQPSNAEGVPHVFLDLKRQMTFLERVANHAISIVEYLLSLFVYYKNQQLYE